MPLYNKIKYNCVAWLNLGEPTFSFPDLEAAHLLVSTKNREPWPDPISKACAKYSFCILNQ